MMKEIGTKYVDTKVTCACGNTFTVKSNKSELHIETCDKCHPHYTGQQLSTSKKGNVEKFKAKLEKKAA
ncbi:MAG: 50S ribosomal protein L31 [Bacilli bacterium]|nr:50S ribosomal protein L31 [Bacilli bacterium]